MGGGGDLLYWKYLQNQCQFEVECITIVGYCYTYNNYMHVQQINLEWETSCQKGTTPFALHGKDNGKAHSNFIRVFLLHFLLQIVQGILQLHVSRMMIRIA